MEETTASTPEDMIERAEEYTNAMRLLGVYPQIAGLLESMAGTLRVATERKPPEKFVDGSIEDLNLMPRSFYVLRRAGVDNVGQLLQLSAADIRAMRNAGARTVCDIRTKLSAFGLNLRGELLYGEE